MPNLKQPGDRPAPRRPDPEDPWPDVRRRSDDDLAAAGRDRDDAPDADDEAFGDEEDEDTFEDEEDLEDE